ncbi:hypothetical protein R3W88_033353 [Solanum pinnatisectum]|uniref:Uncharacterized protein n=1 Tax=Solanum pinnatisectum TaxID=50273 RepID=A0AAV9K363_9SOLN|nr:hypothetical protein R3W88_033353 [Solanum pinnatisectum]
MKAIWNELENYEQIPMCTCDGCKWKKKDHQFLMGLDDTLYGTVRSNMLVADRLLTLNRDGLVARVRGCHNNKELDQALNMIEVEQYVLRLLKLLQEVLKD